jgi:hypothetical protein
MSNSFKNKMTYLAGLADSEARSQIMHENIEGVLHEAYKKALLLEKKRSQSYIKNLIRKVIAKQLNKR